jgi:hypothetical protein
MPPKADPHSTDPQLPDEQQDSHDTTLMCPNCGTPVRFGELSCPQCEHVFAAAGRTQRLPIENGISHHREWPTGEVAVPDQHPIVLEIGNQRLNLPGGEFVTIGRASTVPGETSPDVDLSAFGAEDMGVSRLHIRLRRKGILLYVADLGSTNGTHLNGRRLIPQGERLLRDGDELHLGRLRVKVRF